MMNLILLGMEIIEYKLSGINMYGYIGEHSLKIIDVQFVDLPKIGPEMIISESSLDTQAKYDIIKDVFGAYEQTSLVTQVPGYIYYNDKIFYVFGNYRTCALNEIQNTNIRPTLISPLFLVHKDKITDNPLHGTLDPSMVIETNKLGVNFINVSDNVDYIYHHLNEYELRPTEYPMTDYYAFYDGSATMIYSVGDDVLFSNLNQYLIATDYPTSSLIPYIIYDDSQLEFRFYNTAGDIEIFNTIELKFRYNSYQFKLHQPGNTLFKDPYFAITEYKIGYDETANIMNNGNDYIFSATIAYDAATPFGDPIVYTSGTSEYSYFMDNKDDATFEIDIDNYTIKENEMQLVPSIIDKTIYNNDNILDAIMPHIHFDLITNIDDYLPTRESLASSYSDHIVIDVMIFFQTTFSWDSLSENYLDVDSDGDYILKHNVAYSNSEDKLSPYYSVDETSGEILNDMIYVAVPILLSKDIGELIYLKTEEDE